MGARSTVQQRVVTTPQGQQLLRSIRVGALGGLLLPLVELCEAHGESGGADSTQPDIEDTD